MNFLEKLVGQWYEDQGCFVKLNVKIGKREKGGYEGEIDVLAFDLRNKRVIHVETSTDASSWAKRKEKFTNKFNTAEKYYKEICQEQGLTVNFKNNEWELIRKIIVGVTKTSVKNPFKKNIEIISIRQFIFEINNTMKTRDPMKKAVPENLDLLRAIQFSAFYGKE